MLRPRLPLFSAGPAITPLLYYSGVAFLIYVADGIMSYVAPVFIERQVNNQLMMGFVLSFSSIVGISCDTLFPLAFRKRTHVFFLFATMVMALIFPLLFTFLPHIVVVFCLAMAIWGIYYELLLFAHFQFINSMMHRDQHALSWGVITTFGAIGGLVAPMLASLLLNRQEVYPLWLVIVVLSCGLGFAFIFRHVFSRHTHPHKEDPAIATTPAKTKNGILQELKIWWLLLEKVWPVYIFVLALFIVQASFYSVGILFSENLAEKSALGTLLIPAFVLPTLFTGLVVEPVCKKLGKKRTAFLAGILGGIALACIGFVSQLWMLIALVFVAAIFISLSLPAISGAIQDYVGRLHDHGGEMVGLQNSATSLAYIVGPILAGLTATLVGNQTALAVIGGCFALITFGCFLFTPRKILLPQAEIEDVTTNTSS